MVPEKFLAVQNELLRAHGDAAGRETDPNLERWQLLSAHLRNVADLAEKFAAPFNLGAEAKLAGLLHDL